MAFTSPDQNAAFRYALGLCDPEKEKMMARKRNPQDVTLRNTRTANTRLDDLEQRVRKLEKKVKKLKHKKGA